MGGKSTILRQACLAVILAQIGCYVPCLGLRMTPVDRIFTRLGAEDRLLEGKSTFFVEMEECKNVIKFGTHKSLAILDELGRGTSTFDGYAIAHAVLEHLVSKIRCRTMFSTHYHMLLDDFKNRRGVESYHMLHKSNEEQDQVMFMYKFVKGCSESSFGINVARLAGLPNSIIDKAKAKSNQFRIHLDTLSKKVQRQNR
jgi:DNA mismatch repair protein MSH6